MTLAILLGGPTLAAGVGTTLLSGTWAFDYIVSAVVALGLLIFIHELGHFMVAKAMGVGVERFSLGFGPRIFSFRRGETEYCLSIVPLGGYVKMTGEEAHGEDAIHPTAAAPPIDPAKSFSAKPLWARFLIVFAGPGMNFVLAAAIFSIVFAAVGVAVLEPDGREGDGRTPPRRRSGLRPRDRVVAVDGKPVEHWGEIEAAVQPAEGRPLALTILRDGATPAGDRHAPQGARRGRRSTSPPRPGASARAPTCRRSSARCARECRPPTAGLQPRDRVVALERTADRDLGRARGDDLAPGPTRR